MKSFTRPLTRLRLLVRRGTPYMLGAVTALGTVLVPASIGHAAGTAWLPKDRAIHSILQGYVHPSMVTYQNHAYILNVDDGIAPNKVLLTTNESGSWKTQQVGSEKPANEFVSLAVDSSTGRLYAVWLYKNSPDTVAIGVWMRDASGTWSSGPTNLDIEAALYGAPSVVARNGKAYVAFSSPYPGACDSNRQDVQVVTYDGTGWSTPQNLTSCTATGEGSLFDNPKLALDESGHVYLVSLEYSNNLWYMDTTGGSWSQPVQITTGVDIGLGAVSFAQRGTYSIAASGDTVYVTYAKHLGAGLGSDVFLVSHSAGGSWSSPGRVSIADPAGCLKWGLSLVARSGRLGVSYIQSSTGGCHAAGNPDPFNDSPHLLTGTPGNLTSISLGGKQSCNDTALASDGDLFRLLTVCTPTSGDNEVWYTAEVVPTSGPATRISTPAKVSGSTIPVNWGVKNQADRTSVAYYQVQVQEGNAAYHTLFKTTLQTSTRYHHARSGHVYTFRVRARGTTNLWGSWVKHSTRVR